jgi:chaperonin GroES
MLRAINGKIIVKPSDADEETAGGIIIANAKNDGVIEGEVVAVGPGEYDEKGNFVTPSVEPGNIILMHTMAGQQFEYEDEQYQTISREEVVAVLSR